VKHHVVTVFGGTGFLGRYIVRSLAQEGLQIRVVCRRPEEALRCKPMGDVGQVVPVAANIRNKLSIAAAIEGSDVVINLVGVLFKRGVQNFHSIHVDGARFLAQEAHDAGVKRFIHFSAIGADNNSKSEYARSKKNGEDAVSEIFQEATILRPSLVFGSEDDFFNRFGSMARLLPILPLVGAQTKFQPVYVGDIAKAVVACLHDKMTVSSCYEIGGPAVHSFQELMEMMLIETKRRCLLMPVPFWAASLKAFFLEYLRIPFFLPNPLLTRDQVQLLKIDNIVGTSSLKLEDLGIVPTPLQSVLPSYLARYRPAKFRRNTTRSL